MRNDDFGKYWLAMIMIFLVIFLMVFVKILNPSETIKVRKFNLYESIFEKEPTETVFFIYADGDVYSFTTHDEKRINADIEYLLDYLENGQKKNKGDLAIVVHNHILPAPFSPGNMNVYKLLKRRGFKNFFVLYYPFEKRSLIKE